MVRDFAREHRGTIAKAEKVYSPDSETDPRWNGGHLVVDLSRSAAERLHGWLDRGDSFSWGRKLNGFQRNAPTYSELVDSALFGLKAHLNDRMPALQSSLLTLENQALHSKAVAGERNPSLSEEERTRLVDNLSREDLVALLDTDLQRFQNGPQSSMNVSAARRNILKESRLLEEDLQRYLDLAERANAASTHGEKARLNAQARSYADHITAQNPAIVLFNAALARAKLENAGKLNGEERNRIARAVFSFLGPYLRKGGLYHEGAELENFAFQQCHDPEYRRIRSWLDSNAAEIESKTRPAELERLSDDLKAAYAIRHGDLFFTSKPDAGEFNKAARAFNPKQKGREALSLDESEIKAVQRDGSQLIKDSYLVRNDRGVLRVYDASLKLDLSFRKKTPYSIWNKLQQTDPKTGAIRFNNLEDVHDVLGLRLLVDEPDPHKAQDISYKLLDLLPTAMSKHRMFSVESVSDVHDYLGPNAKPNGYQALHGLLNIYGTPYLTARKIRKLEIQILPKARHEFNESPEGAAHWQHKTARDNTPDILIKSVPSALGHAPAKPKTIPVIVTTEGVGGEPQVVHLHPYNSIFDVLSQTHPHELGHFRVDFALHPHSPKPPNWLGFGKSKPSLFDKIVPNLHLIVTPTKETVPLETVRNWWKNKDQLSDEARMLLRRILGQTRELH